jgi:DNA-binding SARP family transcriptional activator
MTTALVVPALVEAGATGRALEVCDAALADLRATLGEEHSRYARARLLAQRAWIVQRTGAGTGAGDAARAVVLAGPAAPALMRTELGRIRGPLMHATVPPDDMLDLVAAALPGVDALLAFAGHASPAVRAAVARQLARGGDPRAAAALERLEQDDDPEVARTAGAALDRARREPAPRAFTVLGGFALRRGGWEVDQRAWGRPTVARLVRYLLVHHGRPVPEDRILDALWPEHTPPKARLALRVAASRARQVLDPEGAPESAIRFADQAYELVLDDRDRVDAFAFRAAAERALAAEGAQRRTLLRAAAALFAGEPLPEERYADWAQGWRRDLVETHVRVLAELARAERRAGDERAVARIAGELTALDPLDEDAHRVLMTAYARTGRRALALRQFLACRRALTEALGLEPDRQTAALQAAILAGEPV